MPVYSEQVTVESYPNFKPKNQTRYKLQYIEEVRKTFPVHILVQQGKIVRGRQSVNK